MAKIIATYNGVTADNITSLPIKNKDGAIIGTVQLSVTDEGGSGVVVKTKTGTMEFGADDTYGASSIKVMFDDRSDIDLVTISCDTAGNFINLVIMDIAHNYVFWFGKNASTGADFPTGINVIRTDTAIGAFGAKEASINSDHYLIGKAQTNV